MRFYQGNKKHLFLLIVGMAGLRVVHAQEQKILPLSEAVKTGLQNYQSIKAKQHYLQASAEQVKNTRNEYLPNITASIQQDYGTINGQFGPSSAYGAAGTASSGPTYSSQSWSAAFGGVYVLNTNWEVFSFGRLRSRLNYAASQVSKDSADLAQEQFIQSVKISGAYLNLLVTQTLLKSAAANLERAKYVQQVVTARTKSGLNAGVDSSIANAEVSKAKLVLIDATSNEQQFSNQLAQLMNIAPSRYIADSGFLKALPATYTTEFDVEQNPQVKFYKSRVDQSNYYADLLAKSILPGLNLFGIFQTRGSGFDYDYTAVNENYSKNYFSGINPTRTNYVAGLSIAWNIMSIAKIKHQVTAQHFVSKGLQDEYELVSTQLKDQLVLSEQRIENSLQSWREAPVQYKAASDAYLQKSVLYKNGLSNVIDLQQALYLLNRAETDMSVAYINVWQSLLQKAAASGDFDLFLKQVR
ncbi:MAG: TolC family protein [Ferruginibacter sp.]